MLLILHVPNDDTTKLEGVGRKTCAGASAHLPAQVDRDAALHSESTHEGGEDQISSNVAAVHTKPLQYPKALQKTSRFSCWIIHYLIIVCKDGVELLSSQPDTLLDNKNNF